ncbi:MAG: hypothetical protein ACREOL_07090, partial [Candidatus Dormibacteria bacterium]
QLVLNTISGAPTDERAGEAGGGDGRRPVRDGYRIRQAAVQRGIPCLTSLETAAALVQALGSSAKEGLEVGTIDEWRLGPPARAGA